MYENPWQSNAIQLHSSLSLAAASQIHTATLSRAGMRAILTQSAAKELRNDREKTLEEADCRHVVHVQPHSSPSLRSCSGWGGWGGGGGGGREGGDVIRLQWGGGGKKGARKRSVCVREREREREIGFRMQVRFSTTQPMGAAAPDRRWTTEDALLIPSRAERSTFTDGRGWGGVPPSRNHLRYKLQKNQT